MLLIERSEGVETKLIKTSYSPSAGTAYVTFENVGDWAANGLPFIADTKRMSRSRCLWKTFWAKRIKGFTLFCQTLIMKDGVGFRLCMSCIAESEN